MKYAHGTEIKPIYRIWKEEICPINADKKGKRQPRKKVAEQAAAVVERHLNAFKSAKARILAGEKREIIVKEFEAGRV